jgi:hypothetical protein
MLGKRRNAHDVVKKKKQCISSMLESTYCMENDDMSSCEFYIRLNSFITI